MNNPLNLSRRDPDPALSIARYQQDSAGVYTVELFVQTESTRVCVARFICETEREFEQATEFCDLIIKE